MSNLLDPLNPAFIGRVTGALGGLRSSPVPLDTTGGGAYSAYFEVGPLTAGLGANAEIVQFRNPASVLAIVERVDCEGVIATTGFAAGVGRFRIAAARGWTVDGTGGVVLNFGGDNNQMRQTHAAAGSTIRVAGAAGLGVGTKTFDATATLNATPFQSLKGRLFGISATANVDLLPAPVSLLGEEGTGHPLMLALNEGFAILATVPATGVWIAGFTIRWTESTAY